MQGNGEEEQDDEQDNIHSVNDSEYEGDHSSDNADSDNEEHVVMNDEGHHRDEPDDVLVNMFTLIGNKAYDSHGHCSQLGDDVEGTKAVSV